METLVIGRAEFEALQKRATDAEAKLTEALKQRAEFSDELFCAEAEQERLEIQLAWTDHRLQGANDAAKYWREQCDAAYAVLNAFRSASWWRRLWWALTGVEHF